MNDCQERSFYFCAALTSLSVWINIQYLLCFIGNILSLCIAQLVLPQNTAPTPNSLTKTMWRLWPKAKWSFGSRTDTSQKVSTDTNMQMMQSSQISHCCITCYVKICIFHVARCKFTSSGIRTLMFYVIVPWEKHVLSEHTVNVWQMCGFFLQGAKTKFRTPQIYLLTL